MSARGVAVLLSVVLVLAACTPAGPDAPASRAAPAANQAAAANQADTPRGERVIAIAINYEPGFIAAQAPIDPRGPTDHFLRMFNAQLEYHDDKAVGHPYLVEALPALNTDSWRVFPDGRMETRYRLKPNLAWHDGTPLTAHDFVFAHQTATPANGFLTSVPPYNLISEVVAQDDRSFTVRWRSVYPDAAVLMGANRWGLVPLPRHILQEVAAQGIEALQIHPYWNTEFVGAGPFKLTQWERGTHLEAVAFDQHALGRPKIDRIQLQFISDPNTAVANLLAGSTDVALISILFPQMVELKRRWGPREGMAGFTVGAIAAAYFQHRPEYARPRAGLDPAVRKALAHGLDRQTIMETVWEGEVTLRDTIFDPRAEWYSVIDRAITKYPYDPRASERLLTQAGYTKGTDGQWASPAEGHLTFSIVPFPGRLEAPVMAAQWRQIGFDFEELTITAREPGSDSRVPFIYNTGYTVAEVAQMARYRASEVATEERRWVGTNVSGWSNLAFDRLVDAFNSTLDSNERVQQRAQMARLMSDDLPAIQLFEVANPHAVMSQVKNVVNSTTPGAMGRITWNIHQWEVD